MTGRTMPAMVYTRTGPAEEVLRIVELPMPEPGPGEVRVAIHASGVNPHDTKRRSGWTGAIDQKAAYVPHSDGAGIVDAVGAGVDPARIGRRVYVLNAPSGRGTAAGAVVVPADCAPPLPDTLSFIEGAALGIPAYTAWLAVLGDGPVAGEVVLIQGGGGSVGRVCVELAALSGAVVVATGRSGRSRKVARKSGAQIVLPTGSPDLVETILTLSGRVGASRIIEIDFAANQDDDIAALAPHGTLASYS